jgi:hypothetical protein
MFRPRRTQDLSLGKSNFCELEEELEDSGKDFEKE